MTYMAHLIMHGTFLSLYLFFAGLIHFTHKRKKQLKDINSHKLKFSPYLEKLYQSDKPLIIYKVKEGYNLYTDFSKKIILTNHNIDKFFNIFFQ